MATAALVLGLITASFTVGQNTVQTVQFFKSIHHHTTKVVYKKVLKPVGVALSK